MSQRRRISERPAARPTRRSLRCQLTSRSSTSDHLWHPFTQQQGWSEEEPLMIERGEGSYLIDTDGRRYLDGAASLWCNVHGHRHPAIDAAIARAARPHRPLDDARPLPPRRRRARRPPGRRRPAGPQPRLLLGLGLDRGRDRAQDGLPVPAAARRRARPPHLLRAPARGLPRRHARLGLGRRHRPLPLDLPAAALRRPTPPSPATPPTWSGSSPPTARRSPR